MSNIKKKSQGVNTSIEPRDLNEFAAITNNLYTSIAVVSRRADQIAVEIKSELHAKLEEFASGTDNLEEVQENKEQIEISRYYERLPNPAIIATNEFLNDELIYKFREAEVVEAPVVAPVEE